jgi:hypothetical protein
VEGPEALRTSLLVALVTHVPVIPWVLVPADGRRLSTVAAVHDVLSLPPVRALEKAICLHVFTTLLPRREVELGPTYVGKGPLQKFGRLLYKPFPMFRLGDEKKADVERTVWKKPLSAAEILLREAADRKSLPPPQPPPKKSMLYA